MWKMMIFDDEAIIRNGLKKALDWKKFGIEIVGEAEDGEVGVEKCAELKPDILLVDICMPFLNGLDMIKEISSIVPDAIVFIISGHGEFEYARSAIKLDVFDYILKPVDEEYLEERIKYAVSKLEENKLSKAIEDTKPDKQNYYTKRKELFGNILHGKNEDNIDYKLKYYDLEFNDDFGLLVVKTTKIDETIESKSHLEFVTHTQNIVINEILQEFLKGDNGTNIIAEFDHIVVAAFSYINEEFFNKICKDIEDELNAKMISSRITCKARKVPHGIVRIPQVFDELSKDVEAESRFTPMVQTAKKYIDENYADVELNLSAVSEYVECNSSYLSKLLKKELGLSFVDYLTHIRIKNAIRLMEDPKLRIIEISEKVGYSTQHYFSLAFKKVMGVSPSNYKNGEKLKDE